MANSVLLWKGPSVIDGAPIALVATGLKKASSNTKTGGMVQTYIIRSDVSPVDAIHTGADSSICGACPHRGDIVPATDGAHATKNVNRSCYVLVFQGPLNVYKTLTAGKYPDARHNGAELLRGLSVRLGTYGDPAAVPFDVWAALLAHAGKCTGYTHQWRESFCDPRFAQWCMASADSPCEGIAARAMGYRSFRVGTLAESLVKGQEFLCPASEQAGKKLTCESCLACGGTNSPNKASVFIPAHGVASKINAFTERSLASES